MHDPDELLARVRRASWALGPDLYNDLVVALGVQVPDTGPDLLPLPDATDAAQLRVHVLGLAVDLAHYAALDAALTGSRP